MFETIAEAAASDAQLSEGKVLSGREETVLQTLEITVLMNCRNAHACTSLSPNITPYQLALVLAIGEASFQPPSERRNRVVNRKIQECRHAIEQQRLAGASHNLLDGEHQVNHTH